MAGPRGYSSYHGKGSRGKVILAVFLVLVIIAAAVVIRLQHYVVYDDSGRPRMELPWAAEPAESGSASAAGSADGTEDPQVDLTIQEPERTALRALSLPEGPLADWPAVQQTLTDAGETYNAVCYTVKGPDGNVYFDSQQAPLSARKTVEGCAAAIADMTGNTYAVARMSCFRDAAASAELDAMGLKNTGGYIFYDGNNDRWLDPGKPAARQYLCALAVECAQMGFREILLTDLAYPDQGKLDKIDYGGINDRTAALTQFLTELTAALADYQVAVSLELPAQVLLEGENAASGQSLAAFAPLVSRVFADGGDAETTAASLAQAADAAGTGFVPLCRTPAGEDFLQLAP